MIYRVKKLLPVSVLFLVSMLGCAVPSGGFRESGTRAVRGVMDLREQDLHAHGIMDLRGQWEFYWSRLLAPDDFKGKIRPAMTGFLEVPGLWNGYGVDGKKLEGEGFATFRLVILLPGGERLYGIKITEIESAYRLWVNGKELVRGGVVGTSAEGMKASWKRNEVYFSMNADRAEVILQVSNFTHRKGGPEEVIKFGHGADIARNKYHRYGIELFLVGGIFIMGLYHCILYLLRRRDKSTLYFALFCFSVAARALFGGEKIFLDIFPCLNWGAAVTVEYLVLLSLLPFAALFFHSIFTDEMSVTVVRGIMAVIAVLMIAVIATPPSVFTFLVVPYELAVTAFGIYVIIVMIMAALRKKRGALVLLAGSVCLFAAVISDILYNNLLIDTGYLQAFSTAAGLFIFFLAQSGILAMRFSSAFDIAETLSLDLERKVDERTAELREERNKLARIAIVDDLTELYNRRYSLEYLKSEFHRFNRYGAVFSVIVIDMDRFREVNETHGHLAGDDVLREVGIVLKTSTRVSDSCGRFGGEEFIVILPETVKEPAGAIGEKIRVRIESLVFTSESGRFSTTCSVVIVEASRNDDDFSTILQRADAALIRAKEQGGNRVVVA